VVAREGPQVAIHAHAAACLQKDSRPGAVQSILTSTLLKEGKNN